MKRDLAYVVHSDPQVADRVGGSLSDAGFEVSCMTTVDEAEEVISRRQFELPDAILTPLRDMESGDSILIRLLASNPLMEQIPLVVLAGAGSDERRRALRLGLLGVVTPPYDDEETTLTTRLAIDKHRHDQALFGTIAQLSVADLLQTAEVGRRSGTVSFQHAGDKGRLWLRDGRVVSAEVDGGANGKEAVYEIATWETGVFEADFGSVDVEDQFSSSPSELLLEAMRRFDESRVTTEADERQAARDQTIETALIVLNTVVTYAANHVEVELVAERLETIRSELADACGDLRVFGLGAAGEIDLDPDSVFEVPPEDLAGCVSTWVLRFFDRMEDAIAWRFNKAQLAQLLAPWRTQMTRLGFVGLSDSADADDASQENEVSPARVPLTTGSLPEGCLVLDEDLRVAAYAPFGLRVAHLDTDTVADRPLLRVLPEDASAVAEVLLTSLARSSARERSSASSEFEVSTGHHGGTWRINAVRRVRRDGFIITLARVRQLSESLAPVIERDPLQGALLDSGAGRVVVANEDFFDALESSITKHLGFRQPEVLRDLGRSWGLRQAFRLEQHVQRVYRRTLREMETQMALELLSSCLGVLGLGRFEADLSRRDAGLIVIRHHHSPFPERFGAVSGGSCSILSGFHSAVLTYLSGRELAARELSCSADPSDVCVFIVATEERAGKLITAVPGSADHELVEAILDSCRGGEGS